ncbi:MAG: LysR family transcriptional regulator [Psychrilyobacter sp.]|uniref:LysR family transcriptional regulator n=1 Tax=Psychrilyobacter sp. TaxID=2586924 RepID=UPI003C77F53F
MDIRQLKYFLAIAEAKNITKAAKKLYISQPPLSQQLKLLEEELGVILLERSTRKMKLTEAGKLLQHRAKQIIELMETSTKEIKNLNLGVKGILSIGFVSSAGAMLLPEQIHNFYKEYPEIIFQMKEGNTYKILDLLNNGMIEIGIVRTPFNTENFNLIYMPKEPMVAVAREDLFFPSSLKSISLEELKDKPIILDKRFENLITSSCHQVGFQPNIICEGEDSKSILLWTYTGMGIGIVPKSAAKLMPNKNLRSIIIEESELETQTVIVWVKNRPLSEVAETFLLNFKE